MGISPSTLSQGDDTSREGSNIAKVHFRTALCEEIGLNEVLYYWEFNNFMLWNQKTKLTCLRNRVILERPTLKMKQGFYNYKYL